MTPVEAWLSCMCGYVLAYRQDVDGRALARHLENLLPDTRDVFVAIGARGSTKRLQLAAIDLIAAGKTSSGGMPSRAYARALQAVRTDMKGSADRRKLFAKFLTSNELTADQKALADLAIQMLVPNPDTVASKDIRLEKLVSILPDPLIKSMAVPKEADDQGVHIKEIRYLVRKMAGRDDHRLTPEEVKELNDSDPERIKRYKELHKNARLSWERFVRGMIRDNGGRPVKVTDARRQLDDAGIKYHPALDSNEMRKMRIGEATNISSLKQGTLAMYTMDGTELNMAPAPDLTIFWNDKWDPRTDNCYVLQQRSPYQMEGKTTFIRSSKFARGNREKGFNEVLNALPKIPNARKIWLKDLHGADKTRRTLGAMAEVMYHFATRVGTVGNATFGMSTLQMNHVRIVPGKGVVLQYIGKDSKPQKHVLREDDENPEIENCIKVITFLARGKGKKDYLWTDGQGKHITPARINEYVRKRCGLPVNPEKFRNVRGTEMMQNLLESARIPKKASLNDVSSKVKQLAINIGALLGHVRTNKEGGLDTVAHTAIKNYIVPSVIHEFFKSRGFQTPNWVPREGRNGLKGDTE